MLLPSTLPLIKTFLPVGQANGEGDVWDRRLTVKR